MRESVARGWLLLYQGGEYFNENLYYLTGVDAFHTFALISLESSYEALVTNPFQFREIREACVIEDIHAVSPPEVPSTLVRMLSENSVSLLYTDYSFDSRLPLPGELLDRVKKSIPGIRVEPLPAQLQRLRMIKDATEISIIKRGIRVVEEIFSFLPEMIRPGVNESEISAEIHRHLIRGGFNKIYDVFVASGANSAKVFYRKNCDVLKDNSLVLIDICAALDHYVCDLTRIFPTSGRFIQRHEQLVGIVKSVYDNLVQALPNGTSLASLSNRARELFQAHGLDAYYFGKVGHFVGLAPDDPGEQQTPLEKGMVVTLEPGVYVKEEAVGIRLEDTILVH